MKVIVDRIESAVKNDGRIRNMRISVDYSDGLIVLAGEVKTYHQKQLTQEVAKQIVEKCPYFALSIRNNCSVSEQ